VTLHEDNLPALDGALEALDALKRNLDAILYTVPWQRAPVSAKQNCERLLQMMDHGMTMIRTHVVSYYRHEDFHFMDCGIAGGFPHPASAHKK